MILITGSEATGKRSFAEQLGYGKAQMSEDPGSCAPVVFHVERSVRTKEEAEHVLPLLLKKEVVIINEVGSGVIPAVKEDRIAREAAGRLGVLLAKEADTVIRMVCGIPVCLKGTMPETVR